MPTTTDTIIPANIHVLHGTPEQHIMDIAAEVHHFTGKRVGIYYEPPVGSVHVLSPENLVTQYEELPIDVILAFHALPNRITGPREDYYFTTEESGDRISTIGANFPTNLNNTLEYPTYYWNDFRDEQANDIGTDIPCGLIAQNVVYIPFNINGSAPEAIEQIWAPMLTHAVSLASEPDAVTTHQRTNRQHIVDRISSTIQNRQSGRLGELQTNLDSLTTDNQTYRRHLETNERTMRDIQAQYHQIQASRPDPKLTDPDRLMTIVDELANIQLVDTISATPADHKAIRITTEPIVMSVIMGDGDEYTTAAGQFTIDLNFIDTTLTVHNTTGAIDGYDHPHISNGDFCLGGARQLVYSLMADLEFSTAIQVLLDQLQHVNPDDCYFGRWYEFFDGQLDHYFEQEYCTCEDEDCEEQHM